MLQYFLNRPYSLFAMNSFPHCGQVHVRFVFFQFAGLGCRWFHAVLHFSEQNFFLRPLSFCENNPPQFGQMSTYSSGLITSSHKDTALPSFSDCVEMKTAPEENLVLYPKFTELFFRKQRGFSLFVPALLRAHGKGRIVKKPRNKSFSGYSVHRFASY